MATLAIRRSPALRQNDRNCATVLGVPATPLAIDHLGACFGAAYAGIAEACRAVDEPGLALVAVDEVTLRPAGLVLLRARVARSGVAIVGRHERCDLFLDGPAVALRHLAAIVEPVHAFSPGTTGRYRLLDLRTDEGFTDEAGRPLRGVTADGPAIVRLGGFVVFALPLGDATDWPERAADAWAAMPERVYATEAPAGVIERSMMRRSLIVANDGPRDTGAELALSGRGIAGLIEWQGMKRRCAIPVDADALRDGVLFGRYTRCDTSAMVDDPTLSRVHMLLVQAGDTLLAVDTASSSGIRLASCPFERIVALPDRAELQLGRGTRMTWRRFT